MNDSTQLQPYSVDSILLANDIQHNWPKFIPARILCCAVRSYKTIISTFGLYQYAGNMLAKSGDQTMHLRISCQNHFTLLP